MPINIPADLPAKSALEEENIFVMTADRAEAQDIRPLAIAIVNLMPTKIATETQFLRLLGNNPIQVDITLIRPETHTSKNTPPTHIERFYTTFSKIKHRKFDGMIITGAPVENIPFEAVNYWPELKDIIDYSRENIFSTMHICWGCQAALYHTHGIRKYSLMKKMFGVFPHTLLTKNNRLFRGFDDVFNCPHSRHTEIRRSDIERHDDLEIMAESPEAGVCILREKDYHRYYIFGHLEYDPETLALEYQRDVSRGLKIDVPKNYFRHDDPRYPPTVTWRAHAHLLFNNWLNYCVYQETPYSQEDIGTWEVSGNKTSGK